MIRETVHNGRDNPIGLQLLTDGQPADTNAITRMLLELSRRGTTQIIDSITETDVFDWSVGNGAAIIQLGGLALTPGRWSAKLVVFDVSNPNGLVWGDDFAITVKAA